MSLDQTSSRVLRTRTSTAAHPIPDDVRPLHDLADRASEQLRALGVRPEDAVIGIYRSFGRSARIAARVLRTLLAPAACYELTPASGHRVAPDRRGPDAAVVPPEALTLVVDLGRFPHPRARRIAEDAGVPLVTRPLPTLPPADSAASEAVDRGTRAGRTLPLHRPGARPTGARPLAGRGGAGAPAPRSG